MVPRWVNFALFLLALRDHMATFLVVGIFLRDSLHCIDGRSWDSLWGHRRLLSLDCLLSVRQPISDRGWVDRILVILDRIYN